NDKNRETGSPTDAQAGITELVRKAKEGDLEAFQALYQRFANRVLSFVYRMVGSKSEAEDIVQDTFVPAFHKISELKEDSKFQSWLFTIARNNVYQTYRARGVHTTSLDNPTKDNETPEAQRIAAKTKTPEEAILSCELEHIIQESLSDLNEKQREVF